MAKQTTSITVDPDILELARIQRVNVSNVCNIALSSIVRGDTSQDIEGKRERIKKAILEREEDLLRLRVQFETMEAAFNSEEAEQKAQDQEETERWVKAYMAHQKDV